MVAATIATRSTLDRQSQLLSLNNTYRLIIEDLSLCHILKKVNRITEIGIPAYKNRYTINDRSRRK